MRVRRCSIGLLIVLGSTCCMAAPPPPGHPILGAWRVFVEQTNCIETWEFRADGTTHNTSGAEESYSDYSISDQPSAEGYYTLVDTVTQSNGRKDCTGEVGPPVGDRATVYLVPTHGNFVMCLQKPPKFCLFPMTRISKPES